MFAENPGNSSKMKKTLLFCFLTINFLLFTFGLTASTTIPAGNVSGTWTLAGSPYLAQGNIQIADANTLTIQPGVTVNFQGHYKFNVQGRLIAIGSITDSIIFTAANTSNGWGGIRFENTPITNDTSRIVYCKLQYGKATGASPDDEGGGIYINVFSKVIISKSNISNCFANYFGGGIFCGNDNGIGALINNNTISNNTSNYKGGGIFCEFSNPMISNNNISNNMAVSDGGGIYCHMRSSPTISNNTISNNSATAGGGLYCWFESNPTIRNCILWGNGLGQIGLSISSNPNFYYCDVQGGTAAFDLNGNSYTGAYQNNIDLDPLFVSPSGGSGAGFNGLASNWSLQLSSPCIDAGDPATQTPALDIIGNPRIINCYIDIGAYENQSGTFFTVSITQTSQIFCSGHATGALLAIITGSGSSFTYLWSNGQTTPTDTGLIAGSYSVTVNKAGFACPITETITINEPPSAISINDSSTTNIINASCHNQDGNISITPNGGTTPYSYLWSNNSTNQNLSGIGSGTYSVTVTDHNGCNVSDTFVVSTIAPSATQICMVTVDTSSTKNVIIWEKPTNAPIDSFKIYREIAGVYSHVGSIAYTALSEFTDQSSGINPNTTSYKYKLSVLDTCGNESPLSVDHQTVHVQLSLAFPQGVNLSWNDYIGFAFSQYRILRDNIGNGNWQVLDSVSYGITSYTSTDVLPNARYIVEAKRPTPCFSTRQSNTRNSSKSNTALQTTGIDELSKNMAVMIYPNPAGNTLTITGITGKTILRLYDAVGKLIFEKETESTTTLNTSQLTDGIYTLLTVGKSGNSFNKVVISR